jgi:hypothetical protein
LGVLSSLSIRSLAGDTAEAIAELQGAYCEAILARQWAGRYFVTVQTAPGTLKRQSAALPLPPNAAVVAVDNGIYAEDTGREQS